MYKIIVSEPFNYKNLENKNEIFGKIIKRFSTSFLIKINHQVNINEKVGDHLLVFPRHDGIGDLKTGISINGLLVSSAKNILNEDEGEIMKKSKFVLIGTLIEN